MKTIIQVASYQRYECMDASICKKPVHECAWGRHRFRVFLRLLFTLLLHRKLRPKLAWNLLLQPFAVGGRIELRGLLEDPRLGGTGGRIPTGRQCTMGYLRRFHGSCRLNIGKNVSSREEEAWNWSTHVCCLNRVQLCSNLHNLIP